MIGNENPCRDRECLDYRRNTLAHLQVCVGRATWSLASLMLAGRF